MTAPLLAHRIGVQPARYSSSECRNGGAFDLDRSSDGWPVY